MPLHPLRAGLMPPGLDSRRPPSPFRAQADAALAGFRAACDELGRQVRRGDLTPKFARRQAADLARRLRDDLLAEGERPAAAPPLLVERLAQVAESRRRQALSPSLEALQRETNRLLRDVLVEQQIVARAPEFEARAYARPMAGGAPAPTLQGLLAFHGLAGEASDEPAREWARRQLEALRPRLAEPDDHRRLDAACDRPDRVNPRAVSRYLEALAGGDADDLEAFAAHALDGADASACCAAFALAREAPEGVAARWVRRVLDGLPSFPDAAIKALQAWEAEARLGDAEAARACAEHAASLADREAQAFDPAAPPDEQIRRQERLAALPVAAPHEPIGLTLARRGRTPAELARDAAPADGDETPDSPTEA